MHGAAAMRKEMQMVEAETQAQSIAILRDGRPVRYRGHEIPAPPENERTHRAARAWLLAHSCVPVGPPPQIEGATQITVRVPGDVATRLAELADERGVSQAAVTRDAIVRGLDAGE